MKYVEKAPALAPHPFRMRGVTAHKTEQRFNHIVFFSVIPAKAGIQIKKMVLDSRLRGNNNAQSCEQILRGGLRFSKMCATILDRNRTLRKHKQIKQKGRVMEEKKFRIAMVARMKHGVLYEAIKKRGWTVKTAAEFLGIRHSDLCSTINLKRKPPFLFSRKDDEDTKQKARALTEKLMELTGMTVEDLFPAEFRTDEFLASPKTTERFADVPTRLLLEQTGMLALPPAPDEDLMAREDLEEMQESFAGLSEFDQNILEKRFFENETLREVGERIGFTPEAIRQKQNIALKKMRRVIQKDLAG